MANELTVSVCYARPPQAGGIWERTLQLPGGATLEQALQASGFAQAFGGQDPWQHGAGVFGRRAGPQTRLRDGDRVEIYRALSFDPKESRRRRDAHRRARIAETGGRVRPAGLL
ncbi:electron transporter [Bordetella trematum]|uniref:UPF0125 protein SAMEA3906487_03396 n=1 Tax=Bordetella trematum TaxID=123899 RepID=A0A157JVQ8_9BORD|nr:RnfH family protein [Bordetella trematum]AUL47318.1 RnfH family protein [Bordetella trematum]AZR94181.1 electron transporter [Bordetella trematum]NNH20460.1 RnfH family protein [Bordetella trematum]QIM72722.1 RnfH family protein [Bordetella trematum]SAH75986.1 Uncharacterised protein family (UPF0125) [Bordetella trematum]